MKYVWLNLNTGEFSNSWKIDETFSKDFNKSIIENSRTDAYAKSGWKLIRYTCLNDKDFEFYNKMRLR